MTKLDQTAGVLLTNKAQVSKWRFELLHPTSRDCKPEQYKKKTDFTFFINVTISSVVLDISAFVLVIESLAVLNLFSFFDVFHRFLLSVYKKPDSSTVFRLPFSEPLLVCPYFPQ